MLGCAEDDVTPATKKWTREQAMTAVRAAANSPMADSSKHELLLLINKLWIEDPYLKVLHGLQEDEVVIVLQIQQELDKQCLSKNYYGGRKSHGPKKGDS